MLDFTNSRAHLDRQNDLVIFVGRDSSRDVPFSIGPIALGVLDATADVKNALDIYNRHQQAIHEVALRIYEAEKRTSLRKVDFAGGAGGYSID